MHNVKMSQNPRKFAEKIALHTQKQQEQTEAFQGILNETKQILKVVTHGGVKLKKSVYMG